MKIRFKHYLHQGDRIDLEEKFKDLATEHGVELDSKELRDLGYTFYEVELLCEWDTETGQVDLVSAMM